MSLEAIGEYVCDVDEMADGTSRLVPGDPPAVLFRVDGQFYATHEWCSHEEWSLAEDSDVIGFEVECGLHLARFDIRTGQATCLPATKPITTYRVTVTDSKVYLDR